MNRWEVALGGVVPWRACLRWGCGLAAILYSAGCWLSETPEPLSSKQGRARAHAPNNDAGNGVESARAGVDLRVARRADGGAAVARSHDASDSGAELEVTAVNADAGRGPAQVGSRSTDAGALVNPRAPFLPALATSFRAPAYPLITHDPYFSVWSTSDALPGEWPRRWNGTICGFVSMIRIDGRTFRLLGGDRSATTELSQQGPFVLPTRTIYRFENEQVELHLVFESPLLPANLDVLSRPVSYITWNVRAKDGQPHAVALYFDSSAEIAVDSADQPVRWSKVDLADHWVHRIGTVEQAVLQKTGENIDWGHLYVAAKKAPGVVQRVQSDVSARTAFVAQGAFSGVDDFDMPRAANASWPVIATVFDLGQVRDDTVSRTLLLAYDDVYSIEYMHAPLRPYWKHTLPDVASLLRAASDDYPALDEQCRALDAELLSDLQNIGGDALRQLGTLAFRQAIAAHKLTLSPDDRPWFFPRENGSGGFISTVDVIFPSAPLFLLTAPKLLEGMLEPVLAYADSANWTFEFAPHDLGAYPLANGPTYGGAATDATPTGQMPVEESSNMLILTAALTLASKDTRLAEQYFSLFTRWAHYLEAQGPDPVDQLTTDDFTPHIGHNANLSAKASIGLGAYALLCAQTGRDAEAERYRRIAVSFAKDWAKLADDGDHSRLAFDRPGTWSQKYNLAMDQVLGTQLFDVALLEREVAYYREQQNTYGLPLDSRDSATKLDWIVWSATLTGRPEDLAALLAPISRFLAATPDRVPLTDYYDTVNGQSRGFKARSVVGAVFIPLLHDREVLSRWLGKSLHPVMR